MADKIRNQSVVSASGRHKSVAEEPVTSVLSGGEVPVFDRELTADEEVLAALGYKPEFKREFSLWTSFCVSFAVLGLLPSFASTLYYGKFPSEKWENIFLFKQQCLSRLDVRNFCEVGVEKMDETLRTQHPHPSSKSNSITTNKDFADSILAIGMGYAGTAGMVWGWIIAMLFIQCVAMGMAELCSSMPTSGGLYYASAVLAPPGYGPLAAWITGWSNWLAQVTGAPSVDYALSAMILAAAAINDPSYVPQNYQIFLLTALIMLIHGCISSMPTRWIATFNSYGSTFNIIALIIVVILIPADTNRTSQGLSRFNSSSSVWGDIYKGTDFPDGVAILMSFVAVIWTMSGYDAPFHLSEECSNANVASPRAIGKLSERILYPKTNICFSYDFRIWRPLRLVPPTRLCLHRH